RTRPAATRFPYTTLFRSGRTERPDVPGDHVVWWNVGVDDPEARRHGRESEESARDIDDVGRHLDPAILVHVEGRPGRIDPGGDRSEEHTSELQSRFDLVC